MPSRQEATLQFVDGSTARFLHCRVCGHSAFRLPYKPHDVAGECSCDSFRRSAFGCPNPPRRHLGAGDEGIRAPQRVAPVQYRRRRRQQGDRRMG